MLAPAARRILRALSLLAAALLLGAAAAAGPVRDAEARFERVWELVAERYWDLPRTGVDWDAQRTPYRERALAAPDEEAFHAVLAEMVGLLADDHSRYVPPAEVEEVRDAYGDLPCLGVFAATSADGGSGPIRWRLEDGLGVIVVPDLAQGGVTAGIRAGVEALQGGGARALVLDLRGNPGGRLVTMMTTAGVFTDGFLWRVATTWSLPIPYPALGATATELPLAILTDGDVHSAAEGLAGALQASGRATVVGTRTAGNVEAVLPFCLRDGAQVWLAAGVLAPVAGPTWEGEGVAPDIETAPDGALAAARKALLGRP